MPGASPVNQKLDEIQSYLTKALNSGLKGECKTKGLAYIECALAILAEVREQVEQDG